MARFGVQYDDSQLRKGNQSVESGISKLRTFATVVAGSALVVGMRNFVDNIRAQGDQLDKVSSKLGISAAALQEYQFAAGQTGVRVEAVNMGLQRFVRRVAEAQQGTGEAQKIIQQYNIALEDANGQARSAEAILGDVADTIKNTTSEQEKLRIAFKFFDSEGAALVNTLKDGKEGLEALKQEFRDLGGGLSQDAIDASVELTDQLGRMEVASMGLKSQLAIFLLPIVTRITEGMTKFAAMVREATKDTNIMGPAIAAFGAAAAGALLKAVGPLRIFLATLGKLILRLALPVLLMDELITTFQGGDTLIRRAIDGMFGEGTTGKIVTFIKEGLVKAKDRLIELVEDLRGPAKRAMERIGEAIDDVTAFLKDNAAAIAIGIFLFAAFRIAVNLMKKATIAYQIIVKAITGFQWAWNGAIAAGEGALLLLRGASLKALPGLVALGAPIWAVVAAAAAATGAVVLLITQLNKLSDLTEGLGITGIIDQMVERGTWDPFEAVDAFQNEQARKRAQEVPTGGGRGAGDSAGAQGGGSKQGVTNNQRVEQNVTNNFNLPPGTPPEQAQAIRKTLQTAMGDVNRATQAALTPAG